MPQNTSPCGRPPSETGESCDNMELPQLPGNQSLSYFFCESRPLKDGKFSLECNAVDKKHLPSSSAKSCSQPQSNGMHGKCGKELKDDKSSPECECVGKKKLPCSSKNVPCSSATFKTEPRSQLRSVNESNGMHGKCGKELKDDKSSPECECVGKKNLPCSSKNVPCSSATFKTEPRSQLRSVNESNGKCGKQKTCHGVTVNPNPCKRLTFEQGLETEACRARARFCSMPKPRSPCCEKSPFCLSCCVEQEPEPTRYYQIAPKDPCVAEELCEVDPCTEACPCDDCEKEPIDVGCECDPCLQNCCTKRPIRKKCDPNCFCCVGNGDVFAYDERVVTVCCRPPCVKKCRCICDSCSDDVFDLAGVRCTYNGLHHICCKDVGASCPCTEKVDECCPETTSATSVMIRQSDGEDNGEEEKNK